MRPARVAAREARPAFANPASATPLSPPPAPAEEKPPFEGTDEEHGAAVKLQSTFRGHVARREVAADRARAEETELTNAATKVQAGFRGHLARKQVAGMKGGDA